MSNTIYRKNEFRYGKRNSPMGRHPVYISAESTDKYKVNVITHSDTFFGQPTKELIDNPDKRKNRISIPVVIDKSELQNHRLNNWKMSKQNTKIRKKLDKRYRVVIT